MRKPLCIAVVMLSGCSLLQPGVKADARVDARADVDAAFQAMARLSAEFAALKSEITGDVVAGKKDERNAENQTNITVGGTPWWVWVIAAGVLGWGLPAPLDPIRKKLFDRKLARMGVHPR